jgi:hypothetical protein
MVLAYIARIIENILTKNASYLQKKRNKKMVEVGIAAVLERPSTESRLGLPACVVKFSKEPDEE